MPALNAEGEMEVVLAEKAHGARGDGEGRVPCGTAPLNV